MNLTDELKKIKLDLECGECHKDFSVDYEEAARHLSEKEVAMLNGKILQTVNKAGMSVAEFVKEGPATLYLNCVHPVTCCSECEQDRITRKARRAARKKENKDIRAEAILVLADEKIPPRYRIAKPFGNEIPMTDSGTFLGGAPGRGKTHTAVQIAKRWALDNHSSDFIFTSVPELLQETKHEFNLPRSIWESGHQTIVSRCQTCSLLILDDLGVEKHSDWSLETVYLVISHRYDNLLPTIVTSNMGLQEINDNVSQRIASRLSSFALVSLTGKDRRKRD